MGARILIVEDEEKLARFVELELQHEGYETEKVMNGRDALDTALSSHFDLILLDIMLPGLNGLEVLRRLNREEGEEAPPVILLTARDAVMDKVSGLDAGASDYITKPFAIEELLARIRVALKLHTKALHHEERKEEEEEGVFVRGKLSLNTKKHRVLYDGHEITLTNREFLLLQTLLEKVCGYEYAGETNVIDVYVRFLRSKIDEVFGEKVIETVRGVGYVIKRV